MRSWQNGRNVFAKIAGRLWKYWIVDSIQDDDVLYCRDRGRYEDIYWHSGCF